MQIQQHQIPFIRRSPTKAAGHVGHGGQLLSRGVRAFPAFMDRPHHGFDVGLEAGPILYGRVSGSRDSHGFGGYHDCRFPERRADILRYGASACRSRDRKQSKYQEQNAGFVNIFHGTWYRPVLPVGSTIQLRRAEAFAGKEEGSG